MPRHISLRAPVAAFVLAGLGAGALIVSAQPGDAEPALTPAAAPAPTTVTAPEAADAEHVLAQAQADAAAQAAAEAERVAAEEAALRELAAAKAQAEADERAAAAAFAAARTEAARTEQVGVPSDDYWDRMAYCETGGNWGMTGSRYSGGVGFYNGTWDAWGGREFAALAGQATREQQIIVANRVATQGYDGPNGFVAPVGYSGWGCVRKIGYP